MEEESWGRNQRVRERNQARGTQEEESLGGNHARAVLEQDPGKGDGVRVLGEESCSGGTWGATRRHPKATQAGRKLPAHQKGL